jgi:hypothetical protein
MGLGPGDRGPIASTTRAPTRAVRVAWSAQLPSRCITSSASARAATSSLPLYTAAAPLSRSALATIGFRTSCAARTTTASRGTTLRCPGAVTTATTPPTAPLTRGAPVAEGRRTDPILHRPHGSQRRGPRSTAAVWSETVPAHRWALPPSRRVSVLRRTACDRLRRAVRDAVKRRRRTGTRPSTCRRLHWYRPYQASGRDPSARCRIKLPPSSAR